MGFVRSTDRGATWNTLENLFPAGNFGRSLAIDPMSPSTLYVAWYDDRTTGGGIARSTTEGASWNQADAGLIDIDIRTLAIDPANGATIYVGGNDGLFKSLNGGASWTSLRKFQLPAPNWPPPVVPAAAVWRASALVRSVFVNPLTPGVVYAHTWRYNACAFSDKLVFKSTDGGSTWSDSASPPFSGCRLSLMAMDPGHPNTIYAAEAEDGAWLRKSTDGGANWNTVWDWTRGMESHLNALTIDPTNSAILYAGLGDFSSFSEQAKCQRINEEHRWRDDLEQRRSYRTRRHRTRY